MPIKKKPVSEKEKLQAKTIDQLKRYAKRVGAKIVTPEGKPKTKEQLVNSALMAQRLGAKKPKAVAKKPATKKTTARKAPIKRTGASSRLLASKNIVDRQLVDEVIIFAENDSKMYEALMKNYLPNLQKKVLAGKYDPEQAIKLLEYYYTNYVRPSMKLPRNYGFDPKLNPDERKLFAKYFRDKLYNEYGLKEVEKAKKSFDKYIK
jgi:hypothetical protein